MSYNAPLVSYRVKTDGTVQYINEVFIIRGIVVHNNSGDNVAFDDTVNPILVIPPGVTTPVPLPSLVSTLRIRTATNTTGIVTIDLYNYPIDTSHAANLQQLPGTITATIPSAVNVTGTVNATTTPASGSVQNVAVSGSVNTNIIGGTVNANATIQNSSIATTVNSGSVTINNTQAQAIPTVSPNVIPTTFTLTRTRTAYTIALTRFTTMITLIATNIRGTGRLTLYYADSSGAVTYLIHEQALISAPSSAQSETFPIYAPPWQKEVSLSSGVTLYFIYTGDADFALEY